MSTLPGRAGSALLVVDVQNGVVAGACHRDETVATIAVLVDQARQQDVPVVWVQHSDDDGLSPGSEAWRLVPELARRDDEPLVPKRFGDAFEDTDLEAVLSARGVARVVLAGAQTDECIRSTLHGAFVRGYDTTLVADAHTTEDLTAWGAPPPEQVIAHTNLYWGNHAGPGRTAEVTSAADLAF